MIETHDYHFAPRFEDNSNPHCSIVFCCDADIELGVVQVGDVLLVVSLEKLSPYTGRRLQSPYGAKRTIQIRLLKNC